MGVMKEGLSAWPETVAYKRMLRNIIRAQDYVPPQQPTGTAPLAEVGETPMTTASSSEDGQLYEVDSSAGEVQFGNWTFFQNRSGDVIARHTTGTEIVLPNNSERNDRG
jgi:hypothetical protein